MGPSWTQTVLVGRGAACVLEGMLVVPMVTGVMEVSMTQMVVVMGLVTVLTVVLLSSSSQ